MWWRAWKSPEAADGNSVRTGPEFRPTRFEYPPDMEVVWHRRMPEFSCAANGVSMLMPHVEPYVVSSVKAVIDDLPQPLADEALAYVRQEGQHHAQHRRFNDLVVGHVPALIRIDRWMASTYGRLGAKRSTTFGVAFAAGFETVAYAAARWVADHEDVLSGADQASVDLFLWHLAEEVEHKNVAIDVYRAIGGNRRTYAGAMLVSAVLLAVFGWLCTTVMLFSTRRWFNPLAHLRLAVWTVSFLFELIPTMIFSISANHHPSSLTDPLMLELVLTEQRLALDRDRRSLRPNDIPERDSVG